MEMLYTLTNQDSEEGTSEAPSLHPAGDDPIILVLLALRILTPALALCTILFTFGSRLFTRIVISLLSEGYEGTSAPPRTPGVESPLSTQAGEQSRLAEGSNANGENGVVSVVVAQTRPRRGLIYSLMTLISLSYMVDGGIVIVRGVLSTIWEPRDVQTWAGLDWYTVGGLLTFAACAIAMSLEERSAGEPCAWGEYYPITVATEVWIGEIAIVGLAGNLLMSSALGVFNVIHLSLLSARIFLLALLVLSHTHWLYRKRFVPLASLSEGARAAYGTFAHGNPSSEGGSGAQTPAQKTAGSALSTHYVTREVHKAQGAVSMVKRIKILFPYLWPKESYKLQLVALICFALLAVGRAVNLFVPLMLGGVTQSLTDGRAPWAYLGIYVALRFLQGGGGIIQVIQNTMWIPVAQYTDRRMSMMTFSHLLDLSLSYHTRRKTGEVLRILDRGSAINTFFQMFLFSFCPIFADIGFAIVYLAVKFDMFLAAMLLVVMIMYVWASVLLTQWRTAIRRLANDKDKYVRGIQGDSLLNWETIKYQCGEEFETSRYLDATLDYQRSEFAVSSSLYMLNFVQNVIIAVALLGGSFTTAYQVNQGKKNVGDFVTFVAYLGQLIGPLNQLGTLYRIVQRNLVDTDNLMKLLAEPKEIEDRPGAITLTGAKGAIEFDNVSFSYDGKVTALDGISFSIPAGSSAAIVGETGSGKSTLLRLLFRFYEPTSGSIKLDGTDIRDITQTSYRQQVGCVPQDMVLFNETIRFNIAYGDIRANGGTGPTMTEVEEAAKAAHIHHRIVKFPDGYETKVGERGVRLSGGERQRVAISRVLIRNPPILLLDEATSSLDSVTEREIQGSLKNLAEGRTSISIAHRLSTIADSDIIFVIADGKIAERGNHDELLKTNGIYATLWKRQSRAESEGEEGLRTPSSPAPIDQHQPQDLTVAERPPHHHH